jgi:hypothetical protein
MLLKTFIGEGRAPSITERLDMPDILAVKENASVVNHPKTYLSEHLPEIAPSTSSTPKA